MAIKSDYQLILDAIDTYIVLYGYRPSMTKIAKTLKKDFKYISVRFNKLVALGYIEIYANGYGAYRVIRWQYDEI